MTRFRVFDHETVRQLSGNSSGAGTIDLVNSGEFFSASPGEVILAPSVNAGEVLYIRIRTTSKTGALPFSPAPTKEPSMHYVATGFLGLEGELEKEIPEPPNPWWKRLFID